MFEIDIPCSIIIVEFVHPQQNVVLTLGYRRSFATVHLIGHVSKRVVFNSYAAIKGPNWIPDGSLDKTIAVH